ncbi:unnamed protein product [Brachionus calyciflorus]|uniref:Reverse transcriptase domain-containing protein n=1 Tax=Brachionus calyciflorus TaxID=104777 RepID=A0A813M3Y6_9BILA|nr:unnamed protein product [Brachionus calyciflorus]
MRGKIVGSAISDIKNLSARSSPFSYYIAFIADIGDAEQDLDIVEVDGKNEEDDENQHEHDIEMESNNEKEANNQHQAEIISFIMFNSSANNILQNNQLQNISLNFTKNHSQNLSDQKPVAGSVFITNNIPKPTNSEKLPKKFHKFGCFSLDPNDDLFIKEERRKIRPDYQMKSSINCLKIDQLLNKNRDEFWRAIKKFKKKQDVKTNEAYNDRIFSVTDIKEAVNKLNFGKSVGGDYISNEMLRFDMNDNISCILEVVFNYMVKHCYTPEKFNISLVTKIPKKDEKKSCNDFRPISVSTTFASLFEGLILNKMDSSKLISNNQFGYKPKSLTKHAFLIVNETINYYKNGGSEIKFASLDATKAFDKLWRDVKNNRLNNQMKSNIYQSTEGVKQGGKLSAYLFNYFINDMSEECFKLDIVAKIGQTNVILAYCNEILILSPSIHI